MDCSFTLTHFGAFARARAHVCVCGVCGVCVCVCVCVCAYVCVCAFVYAGICMSWLSVIGCAWMFVCACESVLSVFVNVSKRMSLRVHACRCVLVCMMCLHICLFSNAIMMHCARPKG